MSNTIMDKPSASLQTAWLLATVGPRITNKRSIKRDILNLSIPEVCSQLGECCQDRSIRYTSSVLHGISMIYKAKIDLLWNDLILIKVKLSKEFLFRGFGSSDPRSFTSKGTETDIDGSSIQRQVFLEDDIQFNLDIDFVRLVNDDTTYPQKRRRLQIQQQDQQIFPSMNYLNTEHPDASTQMVTTIDDQLISNYIDHSMGLRNEVQLAANSSGVDFVFNESGNLINLNLARPDFAAEQAEDVMQFELEDLEIPPELEDQIGEYEPGKSITNDANFHMSTTENQSTYNQVIKSKNELKFHKLVNDKNGNIIVSTENLEESVKSYESRMHSKKTNSCIEISVYESILAEAKKVSGNNRLLSRLKMIALSNSMPEASNAETREITREFSLVRAIERNASGDHDTEIGRDFQHTEMLENLNHGFQGITEGLDLGIVMSEPDDSVLGLSFSELDRSELQSRLQYSKQSESGESNLQKSLDDVSFVDIPLNSQSSLAIQSLKFYKFLISASQTYGTPYIGDEPRLNSIAEISTTNEYRIVKFSNIIPDENTAAAAGESPVSRGLAASCFASILTLATRNMIQLETKGSNLEVGLGRHIDIVVPS
ncbi:uncharacterized protein CANTADRAFT_20460 [Suhomyces tanzawaensis NRRL Y-17324]|uniref:Rad21/Rec8-like protein N-terminal domain-containing protein n=1 Tax=Suhomyces tanzawaensis NRRL Y-17324 TaxID=984487 RepID=A0A1E4SN40_9ASCO|nr:uncharacterized protein CANTADRAFT_20460 [Suhomyces tanzawaensis NRRL Y-17324]ODV80906.1 hypothetical protein CANTADRAFT_20460 [Suhomyces tanzawaensis NRRL Y-17324]